MGGNTGGTDGDEESSGSQSKQGQEYCKQRHVHVFDFEYFFFAADSNQYHCLSEPVWKCESGRDCGCRDCGDIGEHFCRSGICNDDGEVEEEIGKDYLYNVDKAKNCNECIKVIMEIKN